MISDEDSILVADFGEAIITNGSFRNAGGTIVYMAPERLESHDPSSKSDLWSCGVIIYEMIHFRVPFLNAKEILEKNEILFNSSKISKLLERLLVE